MMKGDTRECGDRTTIVCCQKKLEWIYYKDLVGSASRRSDRNRVGPVGAPMTPEIDSMDLYLAVRSRRGLDIRVLCVFPFLRHF